MALGWEGADRRFVEDRGDSRPASLARQRSTSLIEPVLPAFADATPMGDGDNQDIGLMIRTAVRRLPLLLCALLLGAGLGLAALRLLPARYTSWAAIMIDPQHPGMYGEDAQFANLTVDSAQIANVQQVLGSSELLGRVVTAEHLLDDPGFTEPHVSLIGRLLPFVSASPPLQTPEAKRARAVDRLGAMIRTAREGITYVISLSVTAGDAATAQRLARAVTDGYLADQLETKFEAAHRDATWLADRVKSQRNDLIKSEAAVEAIRTKYGLLAASGGPETTVDRQSISQVNTALVNAQGDLDTAAAKYQQAQQVAGRGGNLESLSDVAASGIVSALRGQQAEAKRRVAELSVRYSSEYPSLRQAENDLDAINRQLGTQVATITATLRNDYETALARRDELHKQLAGLVGVVSASDNAEGRIELREAERIAEANRAAYDASLAGLRRIEQQQTRADAEARIISSPSRPDSPSFPRASICLGAGVALGSLAGFAAMFLLPYHRNRVVDVNSARRASSLPVLASAPYLSRRDLLDSGRSISPHEYLVAKPISPFAESLKLLRLRLGIGGAGEPMVVQVTSATPHEGKSTIAASLAVSAATAGIRTVILDLDFHRPSIGKIFTESQVEGLFDVMVPPAADKAGDDGPGNLPLRIIDAAKLVGGIPSQLLENGKLHGLIRDLTAKFDLVVLDTPPVLAITDPLFVSAMVDAIVVVVAWNSTSQRCVDDAVTQLRHARAPVTGVILNKVNPAQSARYGMPHYDYKYAAA